MNWVTIVLVLIIGLLTWRAYRNGFIRELVSLSAVILAIPIAGLFYDNMVPKVEPIVDNLQLARLVSFMAIMGGVIIAGQVAAHLLHGVVVMLNLGAIDHIAGAGFGFLKAVVICQVLLIVLVLFPEPDIRDDIDGSFLATALLDVSQPVLTVLPARFDDGIDFFLDGARALDE